MKKGIFGVAFSAILMLGVTLSVSNVQAQNDEFDDGQGPTRMVDRDNPYDCFDYAWDCGPLG